MNRVFCTLFLAIYTSLCLATPAELLLMANKGQVKFLDGSLAGDVLFIVSDKNGTLHLRKDGWDYYQYRPIISEGADSNKLEATKTESRFIGINPLAYVEEGAPQPYSERFYLGRMLENPVHAHSLKEYWIRDLYPGIDYHVYVDNNNLKYDFIIKAGASVSRIRWQYSGNIDIAAELDGSLSIVGPLGSLSEKAPFSYRNDNKVQIGSSYERTKDGYWTFKLGDGDITAYERTIDPLMLWATFFGGNAQEDLNGLEERTDGSIFVSGVTYSTNYIAFHGYQSTLNGAADLFVARLDSMGMRIWSSYYGGNGTETIGKMLFEGDRTVYLYGSTLSTGYTTRGNKQPISVTDMDGLIIKMDTSGVPYWSVNIGGDSADKIQHIAFTLDSQHLVINGITKSSTQMVNSRGIQHLAADYDGFLARYDTSGQLVWSRLFGGNNIGYEYPVLPVRITSSGNFLTLMATSSTNLGTSNSFKQTNGGNQDLLLTMFDPAGNVKWSGYLGGTGTERSGDIALDGLGNIYVTGITNSATGFTYNPGPRNPQRYQLEDIFLAKIDTAGKMIWSEYLGTQTNEGGYALRMKNDTVIYLAGTGGKTSFFSGGFQDTANSIKDGILMRMDSAGIIRWGTYYGGNGDEFPYAMSLRGNYILVAGTTKSTDFFDGKGSHAQSGGGLSDGFLIRIAEKRMYSGFHFDSVYCAGDTIRVPYFTEDSLKTNSLIRVQLSDVNGQFGTPNTLASTGKSLLGWDTANVVLPVTLQASSNYRVRLVLSVPADTLFFSQVFSVNAAPNRLYANSIKTGLCPDDTLFMISNNPPGFRFTWFKDNVATGDTTKNYFSLAPGYFYCNIENDKGCKVTSVPKTVQNGLVPQAIIRVNDSVFCENTLDLNLSDSSLDAVAADRTWLSETGALGSAQQVNLVNLDTGTHYFRLISKSVHGCSDTATQNILVHPAPKAILLVNDSVACLNAQDFVWTTPPGAGQFTQFDFGDSQAYIGDTAYHQYTKAGNYYSSVLIKNQFACVDSTGLSIRVKGLPKAGFVIPDSLFCANTGPFRLNNQSVGAQTYQWDLGDGNTSGQFHVTHPYPAGLFIIRLIATSAELCRDTVEKTIEIYNPETATISISSTMICPGDSSLFTSNCAAQSVQRWLLNTQLIDTACSVWINDSATYMLIRTDGNGCSDTTSARIGVYPPVQVPGIVQDWDTLKVAATYSVYRWYYAGQLLNSQVSNKLLASQNGNYEVEVEDANGCVARSAVFTISNVGIPFSGKNKGIIVYPNPAYDRLFVGVDEPVLVEVYDMKGNKVLRMDGISSDNPVDVRLLAEGYYLVYLPEFNSRTLVYVRGR